MLMKRQDIKQSSGRKAWNANQLKAALAAIDSANTRAAESDSLPEVCDGHDGAALPDVIVQELDTGCHLQPLRCDQLPGFLVQRRIPVNLHIGAEVRVSTVRALQTPAGCRYASGSIWWQGVSKTAATCLQIILQQPAKACGASMLGS